MKKLILLFLTLTLTLGVFASCNSKRYLQIDDETSSSPSKVMTTEDNQGGTTTAVITQDTLPDFEDETTNPGDVKYVTSYEAKKIGDQWYMVFDSYIANPAAITYFPPEFFYIESIAELRNDILNHRLTLEQMNTIVSNFTRDDVGIPIFNLDEIYIPNIEGDKVVDDDFSFQFQYRGAWDDGQEYSILFFKDTDDTDGITTQKDIDLTFSFRKITKKSYNASIKHCSEKSVKTIQGSTDNSAIFVIPETTVNDNYYNIFIFMSKGENYYEYWIGDFDEIPDDETLLSYGIEKYEG